LSKYNASPEDLYYPDQDAPTAKIEAEGDQDASIVEIEAEGERLELKPTFVNQLEAVLSDDDANDATTLLRYAIDDPANLGSCRTRRRIHYSSCRSLPMDDNDNANFSLPQQR